MREVDDVAAGVESDAARVRNLPHRALFPLGVVLCGFTAPGPRDGAPPQVAMAAHLAKLVDRLQIDTFAVVASSGADLVVVDEDEPGPHGLAAEKSAHRVS